MSDTNNILKKYSGPLEENRTVYDSTTNNGQIDKRETRYILRNPYYEVWIDLENMIVTSMYFNINFYKDNDPDNRISRIYSSKIEYDYGGGYSFSVPFYRQEFSLEIGGSREIKNIEDSINKQKFAGETMGGGKFALCLNVGWKALEDPDNIRYLKSIGYYDKIIETKRLVDELKELFLGNFVSKEMIGEILTNGELSEKSRTMVVELHELKNTTQAKVNEIQLKINELEKNKRELNRKFIQNANGILEEEGGREY